MLTYLHIWTDKCLWQDRDNRTGGRWQRHRNNVRIQSVDEEKMKSNEWFPWLDMDGVQTDKNSAAVMQSRSRVYVSDTNN